VKKKLIKKLRAIFLGIAVLSSQTVQASNDNIEISLFYMRAFNEGIEIKIESKLKSVMPAQSRSYLDKYEENLSIEIKVIPLSIEDHTSSHDNENATTKVKSVSIESVTPILDAAFESSHHKYFRERIYKPFADGSSVSIFVKQNMITTFIVGHNIFGVEVDPGEKKLAELTKSILKLAGFSVEKMKLY